MTDVSDAPLDDDESDAKPVEPEYTEPDHDPVTARNTDPAAMSETERNRRLTEAYEPSPLAE